MNAHKVEMVLAEDGVLVLRGLPFRAGDKVEAIVLEHSQSHHSAIPLDPTDSLYLQGISSIMSEWESEADELAYQNLLGI
jgi:hypothetical protein